MPEDKGVAKKAGPLPLWGWAAVAAGVFVVYRLYSTYKANAAANAANGLSGGTTIPDVLSGGNGTTTSGTNPPVFSSLAAWEQALLDGLPAGSDPAGALNGITNWLSGSCVTPGQYSTISGALSNGSIGLPPGFSIYPTLSVCPGATTTSGTSTGGTSTSTSPASQTPGNTVAVQLTDALGNAIPGGILTGPPGSVPVVTVQNGVSVVSGIHTPPDSGPGHYPGAGLPGKLGLIGRY